MRGLQIAIKRIHPTLSPPSLLNSVPVAFGSPNEQWRAQETEEEARKRRFRMGLEEGELDPEFRRGMVGGMGLTVEKRSDDVEDEKAHEPPLGRRQGVIGEKDTLLDSFAV